MGLTKGAKLSHYEIVAPLFDESADGQRFIVITADRTTTNSITLILDWPAGPKK